MVLGGVLLHHVGLAVICDSLVKARRSVELRKWNTFKGGGGGVP